MGKGGGRGEISQGCLRERILRKRMSKGKGYKIFSFERALWRNIENAKIKRTMRGATV